MDRDTLFAALEDTTSRAILAHTSETERSAQDLADLIDVSLTTVYRRLDRLEDNDLVREGLQLDRDGNHRRVYRATISRIEVDISDDEIRTRVEWHEDMADRFARIWDEIREV